MNAEVLQLFRQAGGTVSITEHKTGCEILTYTDHFEPEKFAYLVIRECAEFVRKENYKAIMNETPFYVTSSDILEHFGIQE
jgi:hypothetical protein